MRILFLHPNFPAQFRHVATRLAAESHEVVFLCQTHYGRTLPGVRRVKLRGPLGHKALEQTKRRGLERQLHQADQYRQGMEKLKQDGLCPAVVVSHSGWGCGLHARLVWPGARLIAYVEWWFAAESPLRDYHPRPEFNLAHNGNAPEHWTRNLTIALEVSGSDACIAPTAWQKDQLPHFLKSRCKVIHDGIDCSLFKPRSKSAATLLTYGTRGMEPVRGFPDFIRELKNWLPSNPDIQVEIAGDDKVYYGANYKGRFGSYGEWAKFKLRKWIEQGQVRFIGSLDFESYCLWLSRSHYHVYLTQPYVASWSLVEAMASGCCIIASNVQPVREFVDDNSALLVDHRQDGWLGAAIEQCRSAPAMAHLRSKQARICAKRYSIHAAYEQWQDLILES